jgi:hypothetical protein
MTARDYASLLIQAYGPALALAVAQNHAGSDLDHDGFWTRVLKILRRKQR